MECNTQNGKRSDGTMDLWFGVFDLQEATTDGGKSFFFARKNSMTTYKE